LGKRPFDHRTTYDEFVNGTIVAPSDSSNQEPAAEGLIHEGVGDHSGTFERNPDEKE